MSQLPDDVKKKIGTLSKEYAKERVTGDVARDEHAETYCDGAEAAYAIAQKQAIAAGKEIQRIVVEPLEQKLSAHSAAAKGPIEDVEGCIECSLCHTTRDVLRDSLAKYKELLGGE